MENVRIASTPLAGLRALGQAADRDSARVSSWLAELHARTPDLAFFFADPETTRDGRRVDWYGPAGNVYVELNALAGEERQSVLDRVEELLALARAEGERLGGATGQAVINATVLPEPREKFIYVARRGGDPASWHPVIVCWAYANEDAALAGRTPQVMVRRSATARTATAAPLSGTGAQAATLASAPTFVTVGRRGPWALLLWLALLLLLLIIAWLMLRACGLGLPGYGLLHHIGRSFCPGVAVAAQADDPERTRALRELAGQLELQAARRRVTCLAEATRSNSQADRDHQNPSVEDRLKREGAQTGELQISLVWDGPSDLDLHVFCPNGDEIYYSHKASCGGTLDVDMNSEKKSLTPVENVYWPDGKVPTGHYRVVVRLYDRHGDERPNIPFEVHIKDGGKVRTVPGTIEHEKTSVGVMEFTR